MYLSFRHKLHCLDCEYEWIPEGWDNFLCDYVYDKSARCVHRVSESQDKQEDRVKLKCPKCQSERIEVEREQKCPVCDGRGTIFPSQLQKKPQS